MFGALPDGWPMSPATRAFVIRRPRNRRSRLFARLQSQVAQDKKFFQLLLGHGRNERLVTSQSYRGFECVADQLLLARAFNRLANLTTQIEQQTDPFMGIGISRT